MHDPESLPFYPYYANILILCCISLYYIMCADTVSVRLFNDAYLRWHMICGIYAIFSTTAVGHRFR